MHRWIASDARVYALLSLLVLLAIYYARRDNWRALGVVSVLALYSHNIASFYLAPIYLAELIVHRNQKTELQKITLTGALSLVFFAPWLPSIFGRSGSFWLNHWLPGNAMKSAIFAAWGTTLPAWMALCVVALLIGTLIYRLATPGVDYWTVVVWLSALLIALYSIVGQNVWFYRPLSPLLIPMAIWIAYALPDWKPARATLTLAWVALLVVGTLNYQPAAKGAHLDRAAEYIAENWQDGDVIYYVTGTVALPFDYYLPDAPHLLMDVEHNPALMQRSHAWAFGIPTGKLTPPVKTCPCCDSPRRWVIIPNDPLLTDDVLESLDWVYRDGTQIGFVDYAQAADIEIWIVE